MVRFLPRWARPLAAAPVLLVALLAAAPAGAVVVHHDGHFYGAVPRHGVQLTGTPTPLSARIPAAPGLARSTALNLNYHGGPVMHSNTVHAMYWDPQNVMPAASKALYTRYFTDLAHDSNSPANTFATTGQYTDATGRAASTSVLGSAATDTRAYPTLPTCTGIAAHCLTDAQIRAEIGRYRRAGGLPSDLNTLYVVFIPAGTPVCFSSTGADCSTNSFCAFHSSIGTGATATLYAVIPDESAEPKACQADGNAAAQRPNGDPADVMLKAVSHEQAEAMTDPLGDAWYTTADGMENGDRCNTTSDNARAFTPTLGGSAAAGTLFNQSLNGNPYYLQSEWSNVTSTCDMAERLVARFTFAPAAARAGAIIHFDSAKALATLGVGRADWTFGDGTTAADARATDHVFAAPGLYPVTVTVTDIAGNTARLTRTVRVKPALA